MGLSTAEINDTKMYMAIYLSSGYLISINDVTGMLIRGKDHQISVTIQREKILVRYLYQKQSSRDQREKGWGS